jgi:hypothetical protein
MPVTVTNPQFPTGSYLVRTKLWGTLILFTQVLILRGVGYKFFKVTNDQTSKHTAEGLAALATAGAAINSEDVVF